MELIAGKISLRQIFLSRRAWRTFWAKNVLLLRWAIVWNVAKMLLCRQGWGYTEYACPSCLTTRRVPHTCKSRFCSSCGKAAVDRWVETTLSALLDVPYQHLVFTIPEELRDWTQMNRKPVLNAMFRAVKDVLLTWTKQRGYRPGLLTVLHTFGADLKFNPHLHVLITCGGLALHNEERWIENRFLPQQCLRPLWRYAFLQALKDLFQAGLLKPPPALRALRTFPEFNSYLTQFYKKEWYVRFGHSLEEKEFTIRYVGRYGKRPVLAESRLEAFDGTTVTFRYKDRATGENVRLSLPVAEFIARLVQHIPDEHFRVLRHAGLFANRCRKKGLAQARRALRQPAPPQPQPLLWRKLLQKTFGQDPLTCPLCQTIMQRVDRLLVTTASVRALVRAKQEEFHGLAQARFHVQRNHRRSAQPQLACASP